MKKRTRKLFTDDEYFFILKNHDRMTITEMANKLKRPRGSVQVVCFRNNLKAKNRSYIPLDADDKRIIRDQRLTGYEVSKIIGCSPELVYYHRKLIQS